MFAGHFVRVGQAYRTVPQPQMTELLSHGKRKMNTAGHRALALLGVSAGLILAGRAVARHLRQFDFRDKTVLITGGSRGFGLVLARQLAAEGAHLALCARDAQELSRAADDLARYQMPVSTHVCDVTDRDQVDPMIH